MCKQIRDRIFSFIPIIIISIIFTKFICAIFSEFAVESEAPWKFGKFT